MIIWNDAGVVARLRDAGCVFAEDEARLLIYEATAPEQLDAMVERRVAGEPLEHILGWADFCGLRIAVGPGVFVPRRRTEHLVHEAVAAGRAGVPGRSVSRPVVVLDMCCGSGAVGCAVADALGRVELHAADIHPAAVACARRNVTAVGGQVYEGDLYEPLPAELRGHVDILVVNAPYVPSSELATLPQEARLHEPRPALDGGPDGLDIQRRVVEDAAGWLAPGGHVLVETSKRQAPTTVEIYTALGFASRVSRSEELDATVVVGTVVVGESADPQWGESSG